MFLHRVQLSGYLITTAIIVPLSLIALTDSAITKHTENKPVDAAAFEFAYETKDEEGNLQMHREKQDGLGRRIGTYGYRHANGIYRFVDYVVDSLGYRASIRTNEPGTRSTIGAYVTVEAAPSPKGPTDGPVRVLPKGVRRVASNADVASPNLQRHRTVTQALSKQPPIPLPVVVVPSPVRIPSSPPSSRSSLSSDAQSDAQEVPRVPEEPVVEIVHAADIVQPPHRQSARFPDPALLFPAPPLIRPPRYRSRSGKLQQQGYIEAAFRKRRS